MLTRASFVTRGLALSTSTLLLPRALRAGADPLPVINVGAFPIDTVGVVYYAQDLGYFKNAGLDVRIQTFPGGPQVAAAVAGGALDVSVTNAASLAAGHLRGVDFKFIAPSAVATDQTRTDLIMVANDSPVQKAADLNGKTIGISGIKSQQQISAMSWVDKHGGDAKSLKFIELPFPQMAQSAAEHRVDAVMLVEPFVTAAKGQLRSLGDALDGVAPTFMILGYFATANWLQANGATAMRFTTAIREAAQWANAHQKESADILLRYAKLDPAVAATMARSTYGITLNPALIQPVIDASAKYGITDKTFPASDLIWQARA